MPDIAAPVAYPVEICNIIDQVVARPDFDHGLWGDGCLELVRCYIRDYYRDVQLGICAYCRSDVSLQASLNCHVEHIAPKSIYKNFIFESKNLCVICADCNVIKREQEVVCNIPDTVKAGARRKKYPRSSGAFKIFRPHFDVYEDHIEVFDSFYVDKTDKGHFTIGACRLNRKIREFGWELPFEEFAVAAAAEKYLEASDPLARSRALRRLKKMLVLV